MDSIQQELEAARKLVKSLEAKLRTVRAEKNFPCLCGESHMFKDCEAIQTHWYEPPHGCTEGDFWHEGELQIICPANGNANRFLFNRNNIPYENHHVFIWDLEAQFKSLYRCQFKKIINDYNKDKRPFKNSYYIDEHHEEYGLHLGPR